MEIKKERGVRKCEKSKNDKKRELGRKKDRKTKSELDRKIE